MSEELLQAFDGPYRDRNTTGFPFAIPHIPRDPLLVARDRFDKAQHEYDEAVRIDEECDGFGIVPDEVKLELRDSTRDLARIESQRLLNAIHPPNQPTP